MPAATTRKSATGPARKYGEATWAEWQRLYVKKRWSMQQIADQYGVASSTVMRRLHGRGAPVRDGAEKQRRVASVVKARKGGLSPTRIAQTLGIGRATVYRYLRENDGKPPYKNSPRKKEHPQ